MADVAENIWQARISGLVGGFRLAREAQQTGKEVESYVLRANAYYAYGLRPQALQCAYVAARLARQDAVIRDAMLAWECEVLGTILFHCGGETILGDLFFELGLNKQPSPADEALLRIGLAEVALKQKDTLLCQLELRLALLLEKQIGHDADVLRSNRQWGRVLKRAGVLLSRLNQTSAASGCFDRAWKIAIHPRFGCRSQRFKLQLVRLYLFFSATHK